MVYVPLRAVLVLRDRRRQRDGPRRARHRGDARLPRHPTALPRPHAAHPEGAPRDVGRSPARPSRAAVRAGSATGGRHGVRARRGGLVRRHEQPGEPERGAPARPRGAPPTQGRLAGLLLAPHEVRLGRRGGGDGPPIANGPGVTIDTDRLFLRRWEPRDLAPFAALNADPDVMRYIGAGRTLTRDESDAFVARIEAGFDEHGFGLWCVEPRDGSAACIGFTGL